MAFSLAIFPVLILYLFLSFSTLFLICSLSSSLSVSSFLNLSHFLDFFSPPFSFSQSYYHSPSPSLSHIHILCVSISISLSQSLNRTELSLSSSLSPPLPFLLSYSFPSSPSLLLSFLPLFLGVVDHGIFAGFTTAVIVAGKDGVRVAGAGGEKPWW